jgi:hypothetical protein
MASLDLVKMLCSGTQHRNEYRDKTDFRAENCDLSSGKQSLSFREWSTL